MVVLRPLRSIPAILNLTISVFYGCDRDGSKRFFMLEEVWKDVPGWEGKYSVSNIGNVKRNKWDGFWGDSLGGYLLKPWVDCAGYRVVSLCSGKKGDAIKIRISRVVAMAFLENNIKNMNVDHINRIRKDDRLENLRLCTQSENMANTGLRSNNTSGFMGVSYHKQNKLWRSYININGKRTRLGLYKDVEEAAKAYDEAAIRLHGEFAVTNESLGLFKEIENVN